MLSRQQTMFSEQQRVVPSGQPNSNCPALQVGSGGFGQHRSTSLAQGTWPLGHAQSPLAVQLVPGKQQNSEHSSGCSSGQVQRLATHAMPAAQHSSPQRTGYAALHTGAHCPSSQLVPTGQQTSPQANSVSEQAQRPPASHKVPAGQQVPSQNGVLTPAPTSPGQQIPPVSSLTFGQASAVSGQNIAM